MSLSLYQSSVPVFERSLVAFLGILDKAEAHAQARKFDPTNYLSTRLVPDMFPLVRQVQTFCDHAKNASFRLAGVQPPRIEDNETTFAELRARVETTLGHLKTIDAKAVDAGVDREVVVPIGANTRLKTQGPNYLMHFALPNFYFHLTTAYDIFRSAGVEIGKRDFLGAVPGVSPA
ncbi:MAG: DUF1993 domain-containing protein [Roseiarcus sp.]|jgi:uncharacterized protein|uniref:DUF1993 domain-containing protein n=1 Tax=Roseiarcus sp. TaxID=1969460 RepID=UPI003BB17880